MAPRVHQPEGARTLLAVVLALLCTACGTGSSASTLAPGGVYQSSLRGQADGWPSSANTFAASDGYHIVGGYLAFAPLGDLTDFDVSVQAKQISGPLTGDYGLAIRRSGKNRYEFDINGSGEWYVLQDINGVHSNLVDLTPNAAIRKGLHATNLLDVRAQGTHFAFSVNGKLVGQVTDAAHPSGEVGLDGDNGIEVVYTNFVVKALS